MRACLRLQNWWGCVCAGSVFVGVPLLAREWTGEHVAAVVFAFGYFWLFLAVAGGGLGLFTDRRSIEVRRARARRLAWPILVALLASCLALWAGLFRL